MPEGIATADLDNASQISTNKHVAIDNVCEVSVLLCRIVLLEKCCLK